MSARSRRAPPAWRAYTGQLAWPTLLLAAVVLVGFVSTSVAAASGAVPLWAGALGNLGWVYLAFTPAHEAAHGNIGGTKRWAWLDRGVGWVCALLFFAPFPAFEAVHLRHHGTVNREGRDPDLWVAGGSTPAIAARCLTIMPHYYWVFLGAMGGESPKLRRARAVAVAALVALGGLGSGLVAAGLGWELLVLWLLPAWLASGVLALVFDWLPHQPHADPGRYTNARVILAPGLPLLMLWQNYHLVHHLWPRVPFYRYGTVFAAMRPELEAEGSPIVSL